MVATTHHAEYIVSKRALLIMLLLAGSSAPPPVPPPMPGVSCSEPSFQPPPSAEGPAQRDTESALPMLMMTEVQPVPVSGPVRQLLAMLLPPL